MNRPCLSGMEPGAGSTRAVEVDGAGGSGAVAWVGAALGWASVGCAAGPAPAWSVVFLYAPDGTLDAGQHFTLQRLAQLPRKLLVVLAAPDPAVADTIPVDADAVLWKALPGYDMAGFAIALHHLADRSPGADVFVMNDSVFGPLAPLEPLLERARWRLTGLLGSAEIENHVQSFAFHLRDVTPALLDALDPLFSRAFAYAAFEPTTLLKEVPLTRRVARIGDAGALWFSPEGNASILQPFALLDDGFPFLKRSLIGKYGHLANREDVLDALARSGHPAV